MMEINPQIGNCNMIVGVRANIQRTILRCVAAHYIIHVNVQQQPKLLVMNEPQTSSEKAVKGERNCKLFYCHFCTRRKSSSFKTHGV